MATRKKKLPPEVTEYLSNLGRKGGKVGGPKGAKARAESLTPERRSEIARKAAAASAKVRAKKKRPTKP